ncbi:MAG: hypothetical protein ACM3NH_02250 [Candidatus Saccharibacteria bacterium]
MHKILRFYNILLGVLILVSVAGLILLLSKTSPVENRLNVILLYADIFIFLMALSSLASFYLRRMFGQRELANLHFKISVREGCLLGILGVLILLLQSKRLLTLVNAGFLTAAIIFLESFLLVHDKQS